MIYRVKKYAIFIFILVAACAMTRVKPAYAVLCPPGSFTSLCNINPANAGGFVSTFVQYLLIFAILASLFFLIWGAIRYIMGGGDKGKIDQARGTIISAIIGLIVSLVAFFILNLILYFFTGQGVTNMQIPTLLQ
jgi:hypothetical protein